jgi:hypothetical protein
MLRICFMTDAEESPVITAVAAVFSSLRMAVKSLFFGLRMEESFADAVSGLAIIEVLAGGCCNGIMAFALTGFTGAAACRPPAGAGFSVIRRRMT